MNKYAFRAHVSYKIVRPNRRNAIMAITIEIPNNIDAWVMKYVGSPPIGRLRAELHIAIPGVISGVISRRDFTRHLKSLKSGT